MSVPKKKPRLKHTVCKPCWELKYCPYGPLVEFFPLITDDLTISEIRRSYKSWIDAVKEGRLKSRKEIYEAIEKILCLEPDRWKWINQYRADELRCSIFGHVCPVFLSAEPFTETREGRNTGRTIPRDIMLKVVRRDGHGPFRPPRHGITIRCTGAAGRAGSEISVVHCGPVNGVVLPKVCHADML